MKTIYLKRISENKDGTYGVLISNNRPFAVTLELPWRENQPNVSCIPIGDYQCKRRSKLYHGYEVFEVMNVYGRSGILIHRGNIKENTKGCILVGEMFDKLMGKKGFLYGILYSKKGYKELMNILKNDDIFHLKIIDCKGEAK